MAFFSVQLVAAIMHGGHVGDGHGDHVDDGHGDHDHHSLLPVWCALHCWCASCYLLCWTQKCPQGGSGGGGQLGTKCRHRRLLWSAGSRAKERFSTLPDAHFVSLLLPKSQAVVFKGLNIFHQHNIPFNCFQVILLIMLTPKHARDGHIHNPQYLSQP